jgi:hypothetical protein
MEQRELGTLLSALDLSFLETGSHRLLHSLVPLLGVDVSVTPCSTETAII